MKGYRFFLAAAALLMVAFPADAGEWITMAVSPRQSIGPTNLTVRLSVEPNADNRTLEVIADSGGFYRSSQIQPGLLIMSTPSNDRRPARTNLPPPVACLRDLSRIGPACGGPAGSSSASYRPDYA
jgi:hypothetical protein